MCKHKLSSGKIKCRICSTKASTKQGFVKLPNNIRDLDVSYKMLIRELGKR